MPELFGSIGCAWAPAGRGGAADAGQ